MERFNPEITMISASAGTGKTYRLLEEVKSALKFTTPDKVVAITFTRAATKEIHQRTKNVGDINVSTIHGFFSSILREQSFYLGKKIGFRVIEEFDEKTIFKQIAAPIILNKIKDEKYKDFFSEYNFTDVLEMLFKMERKYYLIRDKIKTDLNDLVKEERKAQYLRLKNIMSLNFDKDIVEPISSFKGQNEDKVELIRREVEPFVKKMTPLNDIKDFYHNISILKDSPDVLCGNKGSVKNWDPDQLDRVKSAIKSFNVIVRAVRSERLGLDWVIEQSAKYRDLYFRLFLQVHDSYYKKKQELDVLSYNDIEIFTYDLIKNNPKVINYYRDKYDFIFVDEFQDTNFLQRDILFSIAKKIFVVGDSKQSIYKFRNADVRVFMDTQKICQGSPQIELKTNRRSLPSIVDTINESFPRILSSNISTEGRRLFEAEYLGFEPYRNESDGVVRFIKAPSLSDHRKSYNHRLEAKIVADIIEKNVKNGRTYGSHAVLFRASGHMPNFEKQLRDKNIPFIVCGGESRKDLLNSLKSLFNIIINPNDNLSMLEALKLPVFYTSDKELYLSKKERKTIWESLTDHRIKSFVNNMRKKKDHGSFTEFVSDVLRESGFVDSCAKLFPGQEEGAEEFILKSAMHVESKGEGISYFIDYLLNTKNQDPSLSDDINAVKLMTVHSSKGLDFDVVLMPCLNNEPIPAKDTVVISYDGDVAIKLGDDESNKKFNTALYKNIKSNEEEADLAESKRLLYVAMTRAKDELYMISDFEKDSRGLNDNMWVNWIGEIFKDRLEEYQLDEQDDKKIFKIRALEGVIEHPSSVQLIDQNFISRYSVSYIRDQALEKTRDYSFGKSGLGVILHSILENINDKEALGFIYGRIGSKLSDDVSRIIKNLVASEIGQKILSADKFLAEQSFSVLDGRRVISGRIDRINLYKDSVWIIDYKTQVDKEELPAYFAQIECYKIFAKKAFKDKSIRASIVDILNCSEHNV